MCQLLGMNCNVPTDICFSFTGFQARGGLTDVHSDGWGIAFFEGKGVRQFLDSKPSCQSPIADFVKSYPIHSKNVIAHIRKATQGAVNLENTHPFQRELWGQYWVFAHNGNLPDFNPALDDVFRPVGTTDSERAFCLIMQNLRREFGERAPALDDLAESVRRIATEIGSKGEFNFLLSNGQALFAHCSNRLAYVLRRAPFKTAALKDQDVTVDFNTLTGANDRVAVVATIPLTQNESWVTMPAGTLGLFIDGGLHREFTTIPGPPRQEDSVHP